MKKYRVIQWGTGYTGISALRYIVDNPVLELVGIKCYTESKNGKSAGEILGHDASGVQATLSSDELLALEADCVVFMPRDMLDDPSIPGGPAQIWVEEILALLESGKNVVTSICTVTHWRHLQDGPGFIARLNAACQKGNTTVHFTGFDPGFATDVFPYTLASNVGAIEQVRTWEILDYADYPVVEPLTQLGFGVRPEDVPPEGMNAIAVGWGGALHLQAEAMGIQLDDLKVEADVYLAPHSFTAPGGLVVEKGTIAASRWALQGIVDGKVRLVINHVNRIGWDMAPDWPLLGDDGGYRIEMDSFPPVRVDFPMALPGGTGSSFADVMAMTAGRCVNSIEAVVQAESGYKTFLDLPPIGGKYAIVGS